VETQSLGQIFPQWFFYAMGAIIVLNLGTILSVIFFGLKLSFQLGGKFKELEMNDSAIDNKASLAHKRIDKIENKVWS